MKHQTKYPTILSLDIGPISISLVHMAWNKEIIYQDYLFHRGHPREVCLQLFEKYPLQDVKYIVCSTQSPNYFKSSIRYHNSIETITAAKTLNKDLRTLIVIGGEKFYLATFDERKKYLKSKNNTSCAAGTGALLDQQAIRLNLENSSQLAELALKAQGPIPVMATRCSVFTKTDLIHAQQEGYSIEAISQGLCRGLANNIAQTLLGDDIPQSPVILAGGVALNRAVVLALEEFSKSKMIVADSAHNYEALGGCYLFLEEFNRANKSLPPSLALNKAEDIFIDNHLKKRSYYYPPLLKRGTEVQNKRAFKATREIFKTQTVKQLAPVELDFFSPSYENQVFIGLDIGSTSTKAVLLDTNGQVILGAYTRTSGQPLTATQALFEAITYWQQKEKTNLKILGIGATGAGRKFVGSVIGNDLIVDEISAHARAAFHLNPQIDTILEIGGQDAKFTTMQNGLVTSSVMNYICAAGTGSFIEEQAQKLNIPIDEYQEHCLGVQSPITSDCCTVFMERDINHYLQQGYSVPEVLAAVLFAVCENYLRKVVKTGQIGKNVCFQGATAKNQALVAAFEHKLNKKIHVSPYCHLTGALGVALFLKESYRVENKSNFKGLSLFTKQIPIDNKVCQKCANQCKLKKVVLDDQELLFGLKCGGDHDHKSSSSKDLINLREKYLSIKPVISSKVPSYPTIGLPKALYLFGELPFWQLFFNYLNIKTITSENLSKGFVVGKTLAEAEFCAPMNNFLGHVDYLSKTAHYLFIPTYFEEKKDYSENGRSQYCYYGQFASSIVATMNNGKLKNKIITPYLDKNSYRVNIVYQLYNSLKPILLSDISLLQVYKAYQGAQRDFTRKLEQLKLIGKKIISKKINDPKILLIGRPYTILSPYMNNQITNILGKMGVETVYQDMLELDDNFNIDQLLAGGNWYFFKRVLQAANFAASTKGLYPILVTSFKCSPDSLVLGYFRQIMDHHQKPYLIIQLDEHDSSVGVETRIESALRSFKNHLLDKKKDNSLIKKDHPLRIKISTDKSDPDKTLLIPNWDKTCCPLIAANLQSLGVKARLIDEDQLTIQESLKLNSGQCLPVSCIIQGAIKYFQKHSSLDPAQTSLWMLKSQMACNIGLYPHHIKEIFKEYGRGMDEVSLHTGDLTFIEFSKMAPLNTYWAFLLGGMLNKLVCKIRPYERNKGESNRAFKQGLEILVSSFLNKTDKLKAASQVMDIFTKIPTDFPLRPRPQVAILGDLYVRDNPIMNQNLIEFIEEHGGEVVPISFIEYVKSVSSHYLKRWISEGDYKSAFTGQSILATVNLLEKKYLDIFAPLIDRKFFERPKNNIENVLKHFNLKSLHTGESIDNLIKIFHLTSLHPSISLFVQTIPSYCCPGAITQAQTKEIERMVEKPILTITYDGLLTKKNEVLIPYLRN